SFQRGPPSMSQPALGNLSSGNLTEVRSNSPHLHTAWGPLAKCVYVTKLGPRDASPVVPKQRITAAPSVRRCCMLRQSRNSGPKTAHALGTAYGTLQFRDFENLRFAVAW